MTSKREGEILTRVGPGTPMGEMLREAWIPAAKSSELVADGTPVRLMLLGEKLIAFRDTAGRVGIMDHRCPHRCASLFYGRNERGGVRCIYHGWKFDVDGNCLDMPNLPAHQDFKHKLHAKAYRVAERNGLVWLYMGKAETAPPLPAIEPLLLPEAEARINFVQRECNWVQALEGDIDTTHFSFLHLGALNADEVPEDQIGRHSVTSRTPDLHVEDAPYGLRYGASRDGGGGRTYWRIAHFLLPFWTMPPTGPIEHNPMVRGWVPMDDTHTMFISVGWAGNKRALGLRKDGTPVPGHSSELRFKPNATDWYGRWRLADDASNDHGLDREMQRNVNYSGIVGIHLQDQAITESMGPITDFTFEHLAPSDVAITRTRKKLLDAARAHQKTGAVPDAVMRPELCAGARGGEWLSPADRDMRRGYAEARAACDDPTGTLLPAAAE